MPKDNPADKYWKGKIREPKKQPRKLSNKERNEEMDLFDKRNKGKGKK